VRFSLKTLLVLLLFVPPVIAVVAPHAVLRAIAISSFAIAVIFFLARD